MQNILEIKSLNSAQCTWKYCQMEKYFHIILTSGLIQAVRKK